MGCKAIAKRLLNYGRSGPYNTIVPPAPTATLAPHRPANHRSCGCRDACGSSFAIAQPLHSIPKCSRSRQNAARTHSTHKMCITNTLERAGLRIVCSCDLGSRNTRNKWDRIVAETNPNEAYWISCWVGNPLFKFQTHKLIKHNIHDPLRLWRASVNI